MFLLRSICSHHHTAHDLHWDRFSCFWFQKFFHFPQKAQVILLIPVIVCVKRRTPTSNWKWTRHYRFNRSRQFIRVVNIESDCRMFNYAYHYWGKRFLWEKKKQTRIKSLKSNAQGRKQCEHFYQNSYSTFVICAIISIQRYVENIELYGATIDTNTKMCFSTDLAV